MIFRKKRRMVDMRELQRRGVVRIPKNNVEIPTNKDGFVEIGKSKPNTLSNTELFGFSETTSPATTSSDSFTTEAEGYNKREVDEKTTSLDNKIYKLENRIELLEKKLNIEQPTETNFGAMGW